MKILQKICFILLLTMFLSSCSSITQVYSGDCFKDKDFDNCMVLAKQNNVFAQYNLGVMYEKGLGAPQDYKESVKWFRLAAEQGYSDAQYNLGAMYYNGQGVPKDYVMAHMYWNIAALSGDTDAIHHRRIVEKKMTSSQLAESQRMAREWMETHQ